MSLLRFLALIVAGAIFMNIILDTLTSGLEPVMGETAAILFSTTPFAAVLAVWGWYLYGPPKGARAEREAAKGKEDER